MKDGVKIINFVKTFFDGAIFDQEGAIEAGFILAKSFKEREGALECVSKTTFAAKTPSNLEQICYEKGSAASNDDGIEDYFEVPADQTESYLVTSFENAIYDVDGELTDGSTLTRNYDYKGSVIRSEATTRYSGGAITETGTQESTRQRAEAPAS